MAKPTGTIGPNRVSVQADGRIEHTFERIEFSKKKDEVEVMITHDFIASMNQLMAPSGMTWFMSNPVQNPENDFDFTITLPDGHPAWLELMEIAPLELFGGFEKVPASYKPYDLAEIIVGMIRKKGPRTIPRPRAMLANYTCSRTSPIGGSRRARA